MGTVSLGIDLGSTGLRAAYAGPVGDVRIVPAVGGGWRQVFREPGETGLSAVFPSLKSKLGVVSSVWADGRDVDPRDVLSRALTELRRRVAAESSADIGQTVIAVPVNYGSAQRTALRESARAAGLRRVRLVSDSMAAVVAHAGNGTSGTFLVFAMGYRGFEAGLIRAARGQYRTLGHAQALGYGGAAFDEQLLARWIRETCPDGAPATWDDRVWENLRADAQALRERWTGDAAARYPLFLPAGRLADQPSIVVARPYSEYLRGEVTATVNRAAAVLRDASATAADVDAVLLVGGCTRMWPVRELVARLGKTVVTTPETHLAAGAARYARLLAVTPSADDSGPAPDPSETLPDGAQTVPDHARTVAGRGGLATGGKRTTAPPTGPTAILVEARTCMDAGRYDDAVALAHEAWRRARPDETDIFEGMIDIHCVAAENAGSGDFESAGRWLRCALTHGAGNNRVRRLLTELSYERATALSDAGQRELAVQVLEDALRVAADHPPSRDLYRRLKRAKPSRPLHRATAGNAGPGGGYMGLRRANASSRSVTAGERLSSGEIGDERLSCVGAIEAAQEPRGCALLGRMAHSFDVVAVRVTHESAVIAGVVLRPDTGFVQHLGANAGRCLEECPYRSSVRRRECDMGLAEPLASSLPADPEFRLARSAEADDLAKIHHTASAERGEYSIIERGTGAHVSTLNGKVIKHAAIFTIDLVGGHLRSAAAVANLASIRHDLDCALRLTCGNA